MPGNYTITQRADRENIDQPKYMADHQQHVDNLEPPKVDDYSASLAQMQSTIDPGELGSESLPTSLAGELERLRFAIKEIKGTAQWYQTVGIGLLGLWEVGDIKPTGRTTPAAGWLLCDGSAVSRTTYAALFAAIGTAYSPGDGVTTFGLPDLRGRVPVGAGLGPGMAINWALGQKAGAETVVLDLSQIPFHGHAVIDPGHAHHLQPLVGILTPGSGPHFLAASGEVGNAFTDPSFTGIGIAGAGGGLAHGNVQPSIGVNWVIKT